MTFGEVEPFWVSVFAVDPGGDSGWAWLLYERRLLQSDGAVGAVRLGMDISDPWCLFGQVDCSDERHGAERLAHFVRRARERSERIAATDQLRCCLVCEAFILTERTKRASTLSPVRLTARLDAILGDEVEWFEQTAADAKGVCTDDRMKQWGLWQPGQPHATDALRHLVLWLRKELNNEH